MEQSKGDSSGFVEADLLFHQTIFRISGNRVCSMMFTVVHQSVQKLMELTSTLVDPEHTIALHRRILASIRKSDSEEARRRMIEHLEDATGLLAKTAARQTESKLLTRLTKLAAQMDDR
jgi:DNA-binding FadR family transcriptional regulator